MDKKISELPLLGTLENDDFFHVIDDSEVDPSLQNKRVLFSTLKAEISPNLQEVLDQGSSATGLASSFFVESTVGNSIEFKTNGEFVSQSFDVPGAHSFEVSLGLLDFSSFSTIHSNTFTIADTAICEVNNIGGGGSWNIGVGDGMLIGDVGDTGIAATRRLDVNGDVRVRTITQDDLQTRVWVSDISGNLFWRDAATFGSLFGPAGPVTDESIPVFDGTTGDTLKDTTTTIDSIGTIKTGKAYLFNAGTAGDSGIFREGVNFKYKYDNLDYFSFTSSGIGVRAYGGVGFSVNEGVSTDRILTCASNGEVGIGIVNPNQGFHVNKAMRFDVVSQDDTATQILARDGVNDVVWRDVSTLGSSILSATENIVQTSWSGNTDYQYTVTITGAAVGDFCLVNPNNVVFGAINTAGTVWEGYAYCSAVDTVTVVCRVGSFINVSGQTFTVKVLK